MAAASACFKWVDLLESQFDKSWVDMDIIINQIEEDDEEAQIQAALRRHAASLASCFSQLAHKSTVVFQNNAKLEAELIHIREELALARESIDRIQMEKEYLIQKLRSSLLENHHLKYPSGEQSQAVAEKIVDHSPHLEQFNSLHNQYLSERLLVENNELRREIMELESELVGARLDNVYLDKELAGRIQQIQLLASTTSPDVKGRLWTQIESEMCLQRAKTIAQICKTKQELKSRSSVIDGNNRSNKVSNGMGACSTSHDDLQTEEGERGHHRGKQVMVLKNPADDLGMAIIGGTEHNLPIIISEVFPNSAVSRATKLRAGDIILCVNGEDFTHYTHQQAVDSLSVLRGQIVLELQAAEDLSEDDPSNLDFRFYRIFSESGPSPEKETAGQQQQPSSALSSPRSLPGRAVISPELVKGGGGDVVTANTPSTQISEIPPIHTPSPKRENKIT